MIVINDAQQRAATAGHGSPLKIVAGAGTGKTWTMVERFAHLVAEHRLDPNRIVAVTFTNRAAAELRSRVVDRLLELHLVSDRASLDAAWVGTFHGLCVRLLRDHCYDIGFDRDTRVINELEERLLVSDVLTDLRNGLVPAAGILEIEGISAQAAMKVSVEAFAFIQRMKGRGLRPDTLAGSCQACAETYWRDRRVTPSDLVPDAPNEEVAEREVAALICATYQEYETRLGARGMLDFDGILLRVRDALVGNPAWAQRVRDHFAYLIVDEFQDTSAVQHEVLSLLAQPGFANVSVVGDPKQSIYGWRDALIENLIDFSGDEHRLLTNYRSVQPILNLATHVIRGDKRFAFEPHLVAEHGAGDDRSVCLFRADSPEDEARFVAEQILREHADNGTPWSDIALLTRMRRPPVAFEQELRARGIPYVTSGGQGFFDREEIKDIMAHLAVIDDPLDDMALVRLLQGPLTRVTDGQLHRLLRGAQNPDAELRRIWDLVARAEAEGFAVLDGATAARVRISLELVRSLGARRAGMSVGDLVQAVIDETGYAALAAADSAEAPRRLGNLRKLYRLASDFEASQAFTGLDDFIGYVELHDEHDVEVSEADVSGSDAVRVMTIHAAKGLEFPVVFLAQVKPPLDKHEGWLFYDDEFGLILKNLGGEDKVTTRKHDAWFTARAGELPRDVVTAEARRLVYVAITRAERRVYVSATRRREPTWDAVLSALDDKGKPRKQPELDHFRTMALFLRGGGVGTLLESGDLGSPAADTQPAPRHSDAEPSRDAIRLALVGPLHVPTAGDTPLPPVRASVGVEQALLPLDGESHDRHAADPVGKPDGAAAARRAASVAASDGTDLARPPERPVVSFSQLEVLAQCGLRYRYMYEWRLPAPPDDLWPKREPTGDAALGAADLGTLVHSVLELFHQPGADDGAGGLSRLRALWDEVAGAAQGADRAGVAWDTTAGRMFEKYLESDVARMTTIATEQEVNLVVDVAGQPVLVRGFIDRLCRDGDGRTWVVDYKTNRSLGAESLTVYGRQMAIYQRATREALRIDADPLLIEMRTGREHRLNGDSWPDVETLLTTLVGGERVAPPDPPCWGCAYWRGCPASTRRGRAQGA